MDCPGLNSEQVDYFAAKISGDEDLLEGILSFVRHEMDGRFVSKDSLAQDIGRSRTVASKIFYLLEGMMLLDFTFSGMPRTYMAALNDNGREVVKKLVLSEDNPAGVIEVNLERNEVVKVEKQ